MDSGPGWPEGNGAERGAGAAAERRRIADQAALLAEWSQRLAGRADSMTHHAATAMASERARRAAEELARRKSADAAQFVAVLEQMPIGVMLAEIPSGRILLANSAMHELLGRPPPRRAGEVAHEAVGAYHADGRPYAPDEYPLYRAVARLEAIAGEELCYKRDGVPRTLWVRVAPIHDDDGQPVLAIATYEDVTARKALEHSREEFLTAAAHDLKQPLTSMAGYAQLARRRLERMEHPQAAEVLHFVSQLEVSVRSQLALINELVEVARPAMGAALALHRRPTDLVALARAAVERQDVEAGRFVLRAEAPTLEAEVDAGRLERALGNLLQNAAKYSPPSSPIAVRLSRETTPEGAVAVIAVSDQGVGIPKADLPHIFDRFRRGGNVTGQIPGTGIGLASAQAIVEHHGGTITVESVEGDGATFTVYLPLRAHGANGAN